MERAVFFVPGRLDARTGGSIYNQRMVVALRARGWAVDVRELDSSFPRPSNGAIADAAAALAALADDAVVVVDGLAYGAMPDVVAAAAARLRLVALVHMPLADEVGIDDATRRQRQADERRGLRVASAVVVTGRSALSAVQAYGVPRERITVVTPGTDRAPLARGSGGAAVQLLCVAALTPGKGHDVLLQSLATNRSHNWKLTCVGSTTRSPATADALRELIASLKISSRVTFTGELAGAALDAQFHQSDLFVLATLRETFGMAVAEALARGIPVISTATGEIPTLVDERAGLVVPAGDVPAFGAALTRVFADAALRARLHAGAIAARDRLTDWDEAASTMAAVLVRVTHLTTEALRRDQRG